MRKTITRRAGGGVPFCALAIWLLAFGGLARADERPEVLFNQGLAAFLDGDYGVAATRFREAADADPKDANARLWLGIAEARRGDDRTSEKAFEEALAIDPNYGDALLGRGIVRSRLGKTDAAKEDWQRASEIGAGTPVKSEALRRLTGPSLGVKEERSWDLAASLGAEYDTNVLLYPNQGASPPLPTPFPLRPVPRPPPDHLHDARTVYYVEGGYHYQATDRLEVGTRHSFYATTQFRTAGVDIVDYAPSVYANFKADPWLAGIKYTYTLFALGGEVFLSKQELEPSLTLREGNQAFSKLYYRYGRLSFRGSANEANANTDQDGTYQNVGFEQYALLFEKRGYARLGAQFSRNMTEGTEFDASYFRLSGELVAPLPADVFLRINGEQTWGNYDNESVFSQPNVIFYTTGPTFRPVRVPIRVGEKQREILTSAGATLTRNFGRHWTGAARYTYFVNQSTVDAYDWNRSIFSIFATYNF